MGFSFIKLYEWLLEKGIADKEVPSDDFIQKELNGFNSSIFVRWYDKHRILEEKLKEATEAFAWAVDLLPLISTAIAEKGQARLEKIRAK